MKSEYKYWAYDNPAMELVELNCVKTFKDDSKSIKYYNLTYFDGEADGDLLIYKIITIDVCKPNAKHNQCGIIYTTTPYTFGWYNWSIAGTCVYYWNNLRGKPEAYCHDGTFQWTYEELEKDNCEYFISDIMPDWIQSDDEIGEGVVPETRIIRDLLSSGKEDLAEEIYYRLSEYSVIENILKLKEKDLEYLVEKGYTKS